MRKNIFSILLIVFFIGFISEAKGATIDLFDWAFWDNGVVTTSSDPLPTNIDDSSFDWGTGLGALTVNGFGVGSNTFLAFFDHEIDQVLNGFTNEYGGAVNSAMAGQSWEIDEPGFSFGDIYKHVTVDGVLDNLNAVPSTAPEDVSLALGWDFILGVGDAATITLFISETAPGAGFYLRQTDPDSQGVIYLSSALDITRGGVQPVPEPATILLVGSGIAGMTAFSSVLRKIRTGKR